MVIKAPVFTLSGYGAHARDIIMALWNTRRYNLSILPTRWGNTSLLDTGLSPDVSDVLTFCCNNQIRDANNFVYVQITVPPEFQRVSPRMNIGITAGIESNSLPDGWAQACNQMNAIIVPSTFIKELFERGGVTVPVFAVGEGVDTAVFNPTVECRLSLDLSTPFNFLTGGQYIGTAPEGDRKGIGKLIRLFCTAFADRKDVGLIVKSTTMNASSPDQFFTKTKVQMQKKGAEFPRVYLLHGEMTEPELAQLYRHPQIQAFASCTTGESWGRMIAESIASDLPVLVTGWSGHMDYVLDKGVALFEYELGAVPAEFFSPGLFQPGMQWAYAKDKDVERKLRRCQEKYSVAVERAKFMGETFRQRWSRERTDQRLLEVIDNIVKPSTFFPEGTNTAIVPMERI